MDLGIDTDNTDFILRVKYCVKSDSLCGTCVTRLHVASSRKLGKWKGVN